MSQNRVEFGDWQTDYNFAIRVCTLLKEQGINPKVIVEPTCGMGNFIQAALDVFTDIEKVYAIEIYEPYIENIHLIASRYNKVDFRIFHTNIFDFDFSEIEDDDLLFLGNPPWVTNSKLSEIGGNNTPEKSNFKGYKGFDALTGKGNFDIAEYILLKISREHQPKRGKIAFLVKNSVIKNITIGQKRQPYSISNIEQYEFDALKEFGVAANASLVLGEITATPANNRCDVYNLYSKKYIRTFGLINGKVVSDIKMYKNAAFIDGYSTLVWRSGIKHDCAKIMELSSINNSYLNGYGEQCDLEEDQIYPFIKSSDVKQPTITNIRKYLILTQRRTNEETNNLINNAPKLYSYLEKHSGLLDNRKSSIYKTRPRFCLFGIGEYSFKPYKVVVSALYKKVQFSVVGQINDKPVMLDDTCYSIGFERLEFAQITREVLNSGIVMSFIESVSFSDAKRVISKDLLMRIDILTAAKSIGYKELGVTETIFNQYIESLSQQHLLFA